MYVHGADHELAADDAAVAEVGGVAGRGGVRHARTLVGVVPASRPVTPRRGSIRFRLALRTYAPWDARVVSLTESRKLNVNAHPESTSAPFQDAYLAKAQQSWVVIRNATVATPCVMDHTCSGTNMTGHHEYTNLIHIMTLSCCPSARGKQWHSVNNSGVCAGARLCTIHPSARTLHVLSVRAHVLRAHGGGLRRSRGDRTRRNQIGRFRTNIDMLKFEFR